MFQYCIGWREGESGNVSIVPTNGSGPEQSACAAQSGSDDGNGDGTERYVEQFGRKEGSCDCRRECEFPNHRTHDRGGETECCTFGDV